MLDKNPTVKKILMRTDSVLSFAEEVFVSQKDDKFLFLNPNVPDWLVVNNNGAYALNLCAEGKTRHEIMQHLAQMGDENILADVEKLLNKAISHSIVVAEPNQTEKHDGGYAGGASQEKGHLPLRIVHLKLTDDCNLRCKYCYARCGGESKTLSLDELIQVAKDVASISPAVEYVISGGEPLLHPDCLEFSEIVKSGGNEVHLLTNGTLITQANAGRIAELCDLVKISIDGATEKSHAMTRGHNNFDTVTAAVDLLLSLDAPVRVAMTVTRHNMHEIPEMAKRYGSLLTFQPFFHAGRGTDHVDFALTGKEYYLALASAEQVKPLAAFEQVLERARRRGIRRCAIGDAEISISETGDVYPCQMLEENKYCAGNIFKTPLVEIYSNSPVLKRVRKLNINNIEGCTSCPVKLICGGACRARAYHENGRDDVAGDFCEYEKLAYLNGIFDSTTLDG